MRRERLGGDGVDVGVGGGGTARVVVWERRMRAVVWERRTRVLVPWRWYASGIMGCLLKQRMVEFVKKLKGWRDSEK